MKRNVIVSLVHNKVSRRRGFSVIELLMAMTILGVVALGVVRGVSTASSITKNSDRQSVAAQYALQRIEAYAAVDPTTLSATATPVAETLTVRGISFTRTTQIAVNADQSRTVTVTVSPTTGTGETPVRYSTTFNGWGMR